MSDSERPDIAAIREFEYLIRALGAEMAAWRRRAHEAEARWKEAEERADAAELRATAAESGVQPSAASMELERENAELRRRLEAARARTQQLVDRLRFLRQQHEQEAER